VAQLSTLGIIYAPLVGGAQTKQKMKSTKIQKLGGGHYRETKTYDNGAKRVETYKPGFIFRDTKSVEHIKAPKRKS
jgi:hypothetical protein